MKRDLILKLTIVAFVITLLITLILGVKEYKENNSLQNRTLYYYDKEEPAKTKAINEIEKINIGCVKDSYLIQDYSSINTKLLLGNEPKNKEVVVTKYYCEKMQYDPENNVTQIVDNCNEKVLGNKIEIDSNEYNIVGILSESYVTPNVYNTFKNTNYNNVLLVSTDELKDICGEDDYYYKLIFKSYHGLKKDLENNKRNTYHETDVVVRNYKVYCSIILGGLLITIIVLLKLKRRKNGIKKSNKNL